MTDLCGTPLYAAPEVTPWFYVKTDAQAARCRRYGKEVDYWSMGVSLYVMLSGEAPFEQDQSVEKLLTDVCTAPIDTSARPWQRVSEEARPALTTLTTSSYYAAACVRGGRALQPCAPRL
eukprot:scaffold26350_cov66-Phaeocystis_antarctica.AAC.2